MKIRTEMNTDKTEIKIADMLLTEQTNKEMNTDKFGQ